MIKPTQASASSSGSTTSSSSLPAKGQTNLSKAPELIKPTTEQPKQPVATMAFMESIFPNVPRKKLEATGQN